MLIAIILAFLMFLTIFMPYVSASDKSAETIKELDALSAWMGRDSYYFKNFDSTGKDLINFSMAEIEDIYVIYYRGGGNIGIVVTWVILIAIFIIGALAFAFFKKTIAVFIFDLLAFIFFCIYSIAFDNDNYSCYIRIEYNFGIAYYLFIICAISILVCAIVTMVLEQISKQNTIKTQ